MSIVELSLSLSYHIATHAMLPATFFLSLVGLAAAMPAPAPISMLGAAWSPDSGVSAAPEGHLLAKRLACVAVRDCPRTPNGRTTCANGQCKYCEFVVFAEVGRGGKVGGHVVGHHLDHIADRYHTACSVGYTLNSMGTGCIIIRRARVQTSTTAPVPQATTAAPVPTTTSVAATTTAAPVPAVAALTADEQASLDEHNR